MPRLLPNIPRVMDLPGSDVLVYLTSEEHRFLMSIAPELEWNAKGDFVHTEETLDIARTAYVRLVEALRVNELLERLDTQNEILAEARDCICTLAELMNILVTVGLPTTAANLPTVWSGTPNFPFPDGGPIQQNFQNFIPEIIDGSFPSAETGWEKWQDYVCHATNLIRTAAIEKTLELADFFGGAGLTFALFAALLTGMVLTGVGLGIPLVIFGAGAAATLWAAGLELGQSGLQACAEWLENECDWEEIACILHNASNSLVAEEAVRNYIAANAPPELTVGLLALPWQGWIEQVYRGESTEGEYLFVDPSLVPDLCENCDEPTPGSAFLGTGVSGCELDNWHVVSGEAEIILFEDGVYCPPGSGTIGLGFGSGFRGTTFAPATCQSPQFSVDTSETYKITYKATKFSGSSLITAILVDAHLDVDLVEWEMPTNEANSDPLVSTIPVDLVEDYPYRIKIRVANKAFSCADGAITPLT